jgi:hypothetical protein
MVNNIIFLKVNEKAGYWCTRLEGMIINLFLYEGGGLSLGIQIKKINNIKTIRRSDPKVDKVSIKTLCSFSGASILRKKVEIPREISSKQPNFMIG